MDRRELEKLIMEKGYKEGGTKEACIKIREVLNHKMNPGNQLHAPGSCVSIEEFVDAVSILVAAAMQQPDIVVTKDLYYCENDCTYRGRPLCPGEVSLGISKDGLKLCPYYEVEDK